MTGGTRVPDVPRLGVNGLGVNGLGVNALGVNALGVSHPNVSAAVRQPQPPEVASAVNTAPSTAAPTPR